MTKKLCVPIFSLLLAAPALAASYSTNFQKTENPISEGGVWINGEATGIDWTNVQSLNAHAAGANEAPVNYNDATAVLTGSWGPNQRVTATALCGNQNTSIGEEMELRLCTSVSVHRITGYEIMFRNVAQGGYCAIARWNGALGDFTNIGAQTNSYNGIHTGDVIVAQITGGQITVTQNGVTVCQANDSTFTDGSPGVGFDIWSGYANDFGWSTFSATDGGSSANTSPVVASTPTPAPTRPRGPWHLHFVH